MLDPTPPFDDWIKLVFDHPPGNEAWYWNIINDPEIPAREFVVYASRLFKDSARLLAPYTDLQLKYGLDFLINNSGSNQVFALTDDSVPLSDRIEFLNAIFDLNRDCFETRCTSHLSHLDRSETPNHVSELNSNCYMWWDIFIIFPNPEKPAMRPLADASLRVMEKCLTSLSNIAVLEGALHGLGHFQFGYKNEVPKIIAEFLEAHPQLPKELHTYANNAATGCIQ